MINESRPSEEIRTPFSKKKLPKEAIELDESKRSDPSWVNAVVEVGLNNPLLQSGHLEVIDAPGMSENESLDKIVHECIQGVLQVVIYVIDGNSSLRLQVSINAPSKSAIALAHVRCFHFSGKSLRSDISWFSTVSDVSDVSTSFSINDQKVAILIVRLFIA